VRSAGVGEAEAVGYVRRPDAGSVLAGDQQACDGEHLGVGDHVGEHGFRPGDGGGQAVVPTMSWSRTFAVRLSWRRWLCPRECLDQMLIAGQHRKESAATGSRLRHRGPGHRSGDCSGTMPECPRRAHPRVRTCRMTMINLAITMQVKGSG
jgi:hypothetical protein